MIIFDVILLLILACFIFYGLFFGLIRTLGSIVGVLAGAFLASRYYLQVFDWIGSISFGYDNIGKVVVFILLFTIINRLVGLVFAILDRTFNIISIIPFLKTINRLAGAFLGFLEGALILGLIIYVASKYSFLPSMFGGWIVDSEMVPFLLKFVNLLLPLLPEALKMIEGIV
jgi:membrane protein required for colicin V production